MLNENFKNPLLDNYPKIIFSYATDRWSTSYKATIFEKYEFQISVDGKPFNMEIVDTAGQGISSDFFPFNMPLKIYLILST